ncbi:MAG TPA: biotin/lipoyl-containing protein, partial [Reyranellaceae bacterium]|nr:biotin/lipoyl-containing protein [Reyranellaceae bacterium]
KASAVGDRALAIATLARLGEGEAPSADPWSRRDGFRLFDEGHDEVRWKDGEREVTVIARQKRDGGTVLELPGGAVAASACRHPDGRLAITLGGDALDARAVRRTLVDGAVEYTVFGAGEKLRLVDPLDVTQYEASGAGEGSVKSPLPGKIIDLRVKPGDSVAKGQALLVLEAMKMEHTLAAPGDGKVKSVRCAVGEQVAEGAELVEFE